MGTFRRHDDLLRQIPEDVRERAEKAGVTDVDWYAGRLTSTGDNGFTQVPPGRTRELRDAALSRRSARRAERKEKLLSPMMSLISLVRTRPRHTTRDAR
jgi:hypothetical protein